MKCYYQIEYGPWIKGHMRTISSQVLHFWPDKDQQTLKNTIMLSGRNTEFWFADKGITVNGYKEFDQEKNLHQLVAVNVSPGWTKPK